MSFEAGCWVLHIMSFAQDVAQVSTSRNATSSCSCCLACLGVFSRGLHGHGHDA